MRWGATLAVFAATISTAGWAAPHWTSQDLTALHDVIAAAPQEGLTDYDAAPIAVLVPGEIADVLADTIALKLARDFFEGSEHVRDDRTWHIDRGSLDYQAWLDGVLARHSLRAGFQSLLPKDARYAALRRAAAHCTTPAACGRIAANLDRLRAMPRDLGSRYVWVNVPAYRLDLIENGRAVASHRVIVGKPGKETPSFQAKITGVTVNPWWNVPCSIVDESVGKLIASNPKEATRRGYVATKGPDGKLVVRQRPGPDNALGRIKLEMPNPYDVYIHDTPSKDLFASSRRAFSHGCIRTEDPQGLAVSLLGSQQQTEVDILLSTGVSRTLRLAQPIPVYIVYLTAEGDGAAPGGVATYADIYHRDPR
jgi:hypothetical protein